MIRWMLVAVLLAACGSSGSPASVSNAVDAGTEGAAAQPGTGGSAPSDAAVVDDAGLVHLPPGPVSMSFSRADYAMCTWPICPAGIVGLDHNRNYAFTNANHSCQSMGGVAAVVECGACIHRDTCQLFTGRCMAPMIAQVFEDLTPAGIAQCLATVPTVLSRVGWTVCTASLMPDGMFDQTTTAMVCNDNWTPPP